MLIYSDTGAPGITRKRKGRYWQYYAPDGSRITDRDEIERLNALGLPPAYRDCWFCTDPGGHLQAFGFDARGRKQYRYHAGFREAQENRKYEKLAAFGRALPRLRRRVEADLAGKPTSRAAVLAAVVRLIDSTHMRVGNEEYAKDNKSFGATTLRNRHARVERGRVKLSYVGKHGLKRTVTITDRSLARIAKKTQDLPGQHLFEFVNDEGEVCPVTSSHVNAYIKEAMGEDFTAKDFRTWGASVIAFRTMAERAGEKMKLKSVIAPVAEALGNTPAISRKSYVHPALVEAARDAGAIGDAKLPRAGKFLSAHERGLILFLDALPIEVAEIAQEARTAPSRAARKEAQLEATA